MKQKILLTTLCFIGLWIPVACSSESTAQQQASIEPIQTEAMTTNATVQSANQPITTITTGTYFGECFGYCVETLTVTPAKMHFVKGSNVPDESYPDLGGDVDLDGETWDELVNSIDIEEFRGLPNTIGCPDCYDQGGEWIEMTIDGASHRIDIEFEASVPELDKLLAKVRVLRESLSEQYGS